MIVGECKGRNVLIREKSERKHKISKVEQTAVRILTNCLMISKNDEPCMDKGSYCHFCIGLSSSCV